MSLIFGSKKILKKWQPTSSTIPQKIVSGATTLCIIALLLWGQYSIVYFPLRWSEAYFSGKNEITALGLNPIQNLADTRPKDSFVDNTQQAREAYANATKYLGIKNPNAQSLRYDRFLESSNKTNKPNIVIIVIESMSTHKTSFYFDELDSTRFLYNLAQESLYFPNYYASARTTARGMFSIITGIPDVNEYFKTSSRDPYAADQHLIWDNFDDYTKIYMLGGNANWANIRGVISNNVSNVKIYEEGYWKSPRLDVWGVSDKDLLQEANMLLEEQKEPFISLIQLASFHSPFTVPDDLPDFDYTIPDDKFLKKYGFSEFDAKVPLIIHSPKYFPQGKIMPQAGGHTDIFPTAAALAGVRIQNTTMGRDLLDPSFGDDRFIFIRRLNRPPLLVSNEFCYSNEYDEAGGGMLYKREMRPMGEKLGDSLKANNVFLQAEYFTDWQPVKDEDSAFSSKLKQLNEDLWQTALYMLHHNTKAAAKKALDDFENKTGEH